MLPKWSMGKDTLMEIVCKLVVLFVPVDDGLSPLCYSPDFFIFVCIKPNMYSYGDFLIKRAFNIQFLMKSYLLENDECHDKYKEISKQTNAVSSQMIWNVHFFSTYTNWSCCLYFHDNIRDI